MAAKKKKSETPLTLEVFQKVMKTLLTKKEFATTLEAKLAENTKLTKKEFETTLDEKLAENTNLIIEELSKDIRNADERIIKRIQALADDLKPRMLTMENKQDDMEHGLDNHEDRIKKLETV